MTQVVIYILLFSVNVVSASKSYSQNTLISLNVRNRAVKEVFSEIERKSEYVFFYYEDLIDLERKVSLNVKDQTLPVVLDKMFENTGNTYTIDDRQVFISREQQQETPVNATLKIEGTIKNAYGEPLIGVTVQEVGTNNVVTTGVDGRYAIYNVASEVSILRYSYVGLASQAIEVKKQRVIDVVMLDDAQGLDEVVVVGYGTQKRVSVIGAVTTVKPSNLQMNQSRSVTNALAGQVTGIISVQRSGEPGNDASDFWIRGISTFQSVGMSPLVLVDGIERSLSDISPEEIESFSLLKDATATAVYGVRGANGVILVQTKKGQIGKPRVTIKADYGISRPTQLPSFVDGATYMEVMNEAYKLSGFTGQMYSPDRITATREGTDPDLYPNVNWLDAVTRTNVPSSRVSLDINGGSEKLRYSLVVSTFSEKGITVVDKDVDYDATNRLSRYNVRSNVDVDVSPTTNVSVSIGGYILNKNTPGIAPTTIINEAFKNTPIVHPVRYSNGQIPANTSQTNPWAASTQTGFISTYNNSLQSVFAVNQDIGGLWEPLKGLNAKATFSFDAYSWSLLQRTKVTTTHIASGRDDDGNLVTSLTNEGNEFLGYAKGSGGNRAMYFEGQLSYNREIAEKHTIDALFLYNMRDYVNADATTSIMSLPYRTQGIAARLSYNFRNTYFIEGNFGYNGSENFKKNHRWGFFPSVAAGWMISNEPFMAGVKKTISVLKLRASWGLVGNDRLEGRRFPYLSTVDPATGFTFGNTGDLPYSGWVEGFFGRDDMSWETVRKINIGLEIGFLDAINLQADIFHDRRTDIFMQRKTVPETTGFNNNPWANFGIMENRGVELNLDVNKRLSDDWQISARGSFTFVRNKIIEYDESQQLKNTTRSRTGRSTNQYYGLKAIGLFQEEDFRADGTLVDGIPDHTFGVVKPGDIRYEDTNGDERIDSYDYQPIGKPYVPEIVYGFGVSARYRNFDLSMFFQGAANFSNMIQGQMLIPGSGGGGLGNIYSNHADRWTPEDPYRQVFWPRLSTNVSSNNMIYSTWWLQDASYLRLKNLELGYTFPKKWQNAARMQNARLFFRATNLFTWSVFKMWDPEIGSADGLKYPPMKVFSVGFEMSF